MLLADLDDDIRQGRVPPGAELRYAPWTGERFVDLQSLVELTDAFDTPNARFSAHLSRRRAPRAALVVPLFILLCGVLQLMVPLPDRAAQALMQAMNAAMTGFEAVVLRGRWYAPWTSQLVHANLEHLISNLLVIGYSGYRVERALGARGYLTVGAAALLCGSTAVAIFGRMPVIGASVLAYGLLGAQLAIGFRFGEVIPGPHRRYYGYGNLLLFAVLVSQSAFAEGISHLGHLGGFVGGYATAMLLHPPLMWPRADQGRAARRSAITLGALLLLTALIGPLIRAVNGLGWGEEQVVLVEEANVDLRLPARLLGDPRRPSHYQLQGLEAWKVSPTSESVLFCGLRTLSEDAPFAAADFAADWGRPGAELRPLPPPPTRGPGWTSFAADIWEDGQPRVRVIEHRLLRGRQLWRLGMRLELSGDGEPGPEAEVFERALESARVGDPPALEKARINHMSAPTADARLALAQALADVGDLAQADGLYATLITDRGEAAEVAVARRVALWGAHPQDFADPADPAWFEGWMIDYPADDGLQRNGLRWLVARGRCEVARLHLERLRVTVPNAPWLDGLSGCPTE